MWMLVKIWYKFSNLEIFQETVHSGIQGEDVETFSKDTIEFSKARIICGNKGAVVWIMGGLGNLVALAWRTALVGRRSFQKFPYVK